MGKGGSCPPRNKTLFDWLAENLLSSASFIRPPDVFNLDHGVQKTFYFYKKIKKEVINVGGF